MIIWHYNKKQKRLTLYDQKKQKKKLKQNTKQKSILTKQSKKCLKCTYMNDNNICLVFFLFVCLFDMIILYHVKLRQVWQNITCFWIFFFFLFWNLAFDAWLCECYFLTFLLLLFLFLGCIDFKAIGMCHLFFFINCFVYFFVFLFFFFCFLRAWKFCVRV